MHSWIPFFLLWVFFSITAGPEGPVQPAEGPGGRDYLHADVDFSDYAEKQDGYWLFEPAAPRPDSAPVVVFHHGYGAINPMIYGGWIRHLVRRGNIVIYPRYQKNLITPGTQKFAGNAATAIRTALRELRTSDHVRPAAIPPVLVGHSYGAAIAAYLGVNFAELGIPKPRALMLCAPGTGPFKGARLESYEALPADIQLLVMVSVNDHVVGEELGRLVIETARQTPQRLLIRQHPDEYGEPDITAGHNESYAIDTAFDAGIHNFSYRRALHVGTTDAADYYGYWKLLDALLDSSRPDSTNWDELARDTVFLRHMGAWSDGKAIQPLEVVPPQPSAAEVTEVGKEE